jgi:hypothetical protein
VALHIKDWNNVLCQYYLYMWNVVSESYPFSSNSKCPKSLDLSEIRSDQVQATKKQNPLKKGRIQEGEIRMKIILKTPSMF